MSLRDQLLAKGLVSKKQARRVDQEAKQERRHEQGARRSKRESEAEQRQRAEAERRGSEEARKQRRAEYQAQREQTERALQVRHVIRGNRIRGGGPIPFHHLDVDGRRIHRLHVSEGLAQQLRRGDLAIVADEAQYVIVTRRAAAKLDEIAPRLVVFWTRDPAGTSSPDHQFLDRRWEPSLRARRATEADLQRLGVPARGTISTGDAGGSRMNGAPDDNGRPS